MCFNNTDDSDMSVFREGLNKMNITTLGNYRHYKELAKHIQTRNGPET